MTRLTWGNTGERFYELGLDRGVIYPKNADGVAWTGLTSIEENPDGGEATPYYLDGQKYLNLASYEEFKGTIEAINYPDAFAQCDGSSRIGFLIIGQQPRAPFDLSYRTKVGNDIDGNDSAYKIHLVYNAITSPTNKEYSTINDNPSPLSYSWDFTTTPVLTDGRFPISHIVVDSRQTSSEILEAIETILYGDDSLSPSMVNPAILIAMANGSGP